MRHSAPAVEKARCRPAGIRAPGVGRAREPDPRVSRLILTPFVVMSKNQHLHRKTTNSLDLICFVTFNLVLARATREIIRTRSPKQGRGVALTTRPRHGLRSRYRRFPRLIRTRLDASPFNENDDESALRPERRDERLTALVPPAPPRGGARGSRGQRSAGSAGRRSQKEFFVMSGFKVAVVGATGNVGREMLDILAERRFPVSEVVALASSRSIGRKCRSATRRSSARRSSTMTFPTPTSA